MKLFSVLSFYSFPYKRLEHVPRYAVLKDGTTYIDISN